MLSVFLTLFLAAQGSAFAAAQASVPQGRDTRTWYQAYSDAQQKAQQRNWQGVLSDLDAAQRLGAPRPARNVNFYGDVYRDYNPDYYRGLALVNLQRFEEADQAFERVRQAQLITTRDSQYAEFNRQVTNVKDIVQKLAATKQATPPPAAPSGLRTVDAGPPPANVTQTAVNPAGVIPAGVNAAGVTPPNQAAPPLNAASNAAAQQAPPNAIAASKSPIQRPPTPITAERQKQLDAERARLAARSRADVSAALYAASTTQAAAARVDERAAILSYFSGDYQRAAESLSRLASTPGASPRVYLYLAFSQTALMLTGQLPRGAVYDVRSTLAQAGDTAQFERDLSLISPRVRQELGLQ